MAISTLNYLKEMRQDIKDELKQIRDDNKGEHGLITNHLVTLNGKVAKHQETISMMEGAKILELVSKHETYINYAIGTTKVLAIVAIVVGIFSTVITIL